MSTATLTPGRRSQVVRQALSVAVATGTYAISFGALSVAAGLSIVQTQVLSLLLFSGGSQFAFVGVLAAGSSGGPAAIATSTLLGVRNGLYGLQVARMLDVHGLRKAVAAHLTIDESTAVGVAQPEEAGARLGFWVTGVGVFILWNASTLVGAVVGDAMGDPRHYGLDAAAAAAFCALLWPRLKSKDAVAIAVLAAFIAVLVAPHAPTGVPVLVAACTALLAGVWQRAHHDPQPPHQWPDQTRAGTSDNPP